MIVHASLTELIYFGILAVAGTIFGAGYVYERYLMRKRNTRKN